MLTSSPSAPLRPYGASRAAAPAFHPAFAPAWEACQHWFIYKGKSATKGVPRPAGRQGRRPAAASKIAVRRLCVPGDVAAQPIAESRTKSCSQKAAQRPGLPREKSRCGRCRRCSIGGDIIQGSLEEIG